MSFIRHSEEYTKSVMGVITLTAVFVVLLIMPTLLFAESTSVSNSVSVSSGDGTSYSSIKTEVNGEVVEDIESHESGTISSHTVVNGTTSNTYTSSTITTNTEAGGDAEILARIKELIALIQHYVSLLTAIS